MKSDWQGGAMGPYESSFIQLNYVYTMINLFGLFDMVQVVNRSADTQLC